MIALLDHYVDTFKENIEPPAEHEHEKVGVWKDNVKTLVEQMYKNTELMAALQTPELMKFYLKYGLKRGYQQSLLMKPSSTKQVMMNVHGKVS